MSGLSALKLVQAKREKGMSWHSPNFVDTLHNAI